MTRFPGKSPLAPSRLRGLKRYGAQSRRKGGDVGSRADLPALEGLLPLKWRALLLVFLVLTCSLTGCAVGKEWKYLPASKAEERTIYVVTHGWHAGIALSKEDLGQELDFVRDYLIPGEYYEFGWGEAEFYQAEKVTAPIFLKAVFWRNPSVMHVVSLPTPPAAFYSGKGVIELKVSRTGLQHMKNKLRASFEFNQQKRPYPLKGRPSGENRFFKGVDYYLITNTCNRWTAKVLESGGVPMDTVFTLRAASVVRQVNEAKKEYLRLRRFDGASGASGASGAKKAPLPVMAGGKDSIFNQPSLICLLSLPLTYVKPYLKSFLTEKRIFSAIVMTHGLFFLFA